MIPAVAARHETGESGVFGRDVPTLWQAAAAGIGSGLLLWSSFPPLEYSAFAWVALAPLFWLTIQRQARGKAYFAAWLGGLVFWLLALEWVRLSDPSAALGWVLMALVFSLWWPAFILLARWSIFRLGLPLLLAAPIIWVGLEFARAYFLSGFPWYYLAHSQFRWLYVIQIADFTGALGVSFLVAIFNALVVDLLTLPLWRASAHGLHFSRRQNLRLCVATLLLGSTLCYGAYRLNSAQFADGPKLALLQSNIAQRHKMKGDAQVILAEFIELVQRAMAERAVPDLMVWPETSYPNGFITIEPGIDPAQFEQQVAAISNKFTADDWKAWQKTVDDELHEWVDAIRVPMLIGSICYSHKPDSLGKYNSAILLAPDRRTIQLYHKMHLVPFGEYVPLVEIFPWLAALTPYRRERIPSLSFGREPICLSLGPYRLAVSICFEDTMPQVIGRFFRNQGDRPPDVFINLSNDGWFHGSAEQDMHLASGVFRAVEHRVPLARAVNSGLSALVDGNGSILAALPKETKGVLSVTVPLDAREGLYSRWGDWVGRTCLAVTIGLVPLGLVWKKRASSRQNQSKPLNSPP